MSAPAPGERSQDPGPYLTLLFFLSAHRGSLSVAVEVVSTKTTADVMWKDGRLEKNIRSNDLIPIQHIDTHEFCPGDLVVDKRCKTDLVLWDVSFPVLRPPHLVAVCDCASSSGPPGSRCVWRDPVWRS